jgi:membrane-bound inhibitor of C-type lysozyme
MTALWRRVVVSAAVMGCSALAGASDLMIHLPGSQTFTRKMVKYWCDAQGSKLGLPAGVFSVEYINGAGNSLAVVPVSGKAMIFANVISGSGARYAAAQFIWWDAGGRGTIFSSGSMPENVTSECKSIG